MPPGKKDKTGADLGFGSVGPQNFMSVFTDEAQ